MKNLLFIATFLLSSAAGAGIQLNLELKTGYVDGFGKMTISQEALGKLKVTHDPNTCTITELGEVCTQIAPRTVIVDPAVVRDDRPKDGDLVLELFNGMRLSIGAPYNPENQVHIAVILHDDLDTEKRIPMTAVVGFPNLILTIDGHQ